MKKLIFDIGANRGNFTETFLNHFEKVICFEPNPQLVEDLEIRFSNLLNKRVIIDPRALSDKIENKTFNLSNADTLSTFSKDWVNDSRFSNQYSWDKQIVVETTTLDSIIDEYGIPDFIKIDVEGYELFVIQGLTRVLPDTIFSFEWAEESYVSIIKIYEYLKVLGYNQFSFTYTDTFAQNLQWSAWEKLGLHNDISTNRKEKWGMIYFKV